MNELRAARVAAGMTQREVAQYAGVAVANVAAYERGTRPMSGAMRQRILRATVRPSQALQANREAITTILDRIGATNVRVFGSIARGEDTPASDVDLLVDPQPWLSAFDLADAASTIASIVGFEVDIVAARAVPDRKREILDQAVPL